jgi:hypothetical protein
MFNGTGWTTPKPIDPGHDLRAVSCPVAGFCMAVDLEGDALRRTGSTWTATMFDPRRGYPKGVSCPVARFCAAVDGFGNVVYLTSSGWSAFDRIIDDYLVAVSCASRTFCAAITGDGFALVYDGSTWSRSPGLGEGPVSVSCTPGRRILSGA